MYPCYTYVLSVSTYEIYLPLSSSIDSGFTSVILLMLCMDTYLFSETVRVWHIPKGAYPQKYFVYPICLTAWHWCYQAYMSVVYCLVRYLRHVKGPQMGIWGITLW